MAFKNGAYGTLWNVDKGTSTLINFYEKYAVISVSTSRKNKDGKYETDFSGKVRCIGKAFEKLNSVILNEKDKIKFLEVDVTNKYNADTKTMKVTYNCWDLEIQGNPKPKPATQPEIMPDLEPLDDSDDSGLPF